MNDEAAARRFGRMLREASAGSSPHAGHDPELARLMRTVRMIGAPDRSRARRWLWAAAAAAMLVAVLGIATLVGHRDLTYAVRGVARIEDRVVSAESGEPVQVRFSDGSSFELSPGGRLRIDAATRDGARLVLVSGETMASVVHRPRSRWIVAAGPFEIVVVGTRFGARWDADSRQLSVELREGAVEVKGGQLGSPVAVRAGQRLEVAAMANDWRITPLVSSAEHPPASAPAAGETPSSSPAESAPLPTTAPTWQTLMSRSDFATIIAEAQEMGMDRCLASCSPANLRILADAARYTGKFEIAENGLLALRRRAPTQAGVAAFFLGRLYESEGRSAEALRMYDQHLSDGPRGDYAEEAMAGRLRMLVRMGDTARAREAAESYVRRYPGGAHTASARRVIDGAGAP
jgi:transmembrane sensor